MTEFTSQDKIEINRIFESIKGRIDQKLCKVIMNLVFQNQVRMKKEDEKLFNTNKEKIPHRSLEAFSLGGFFGQTYQIGLELSKKMDLQLDRNQKRIFREFTLFLVLLKFEKEFER